ncbi:hypothetical protein CBR_g26181 [Chara braunii]|uniref:Reverse transcriptase domain-containing protein n=1 Tax=Chara braunii TaxID=69332 RepID=A0A388L767_CHABU|nr:hypothetical protein CBR_g26181 [Chara braunii]|eukprot:GBG78145.1 hypothetical protein CBR_g26181 [Chara braunii]
MARSKVLDTEWMDGGLAITTGLLDVMSRILARERNKKDADCRRRVEEAENRMEGHPISAMVWAAERERRIAEWDSLQEEKQKRWTEILKEKGIETNDKMTRESFQKLQPSYTHHQMIELRHPFDLSASHAHSASGMLHYARLYYEDILTTRRPQDSVNTYLSTISDMWTDTSVKLKSTARLDLDQPITVEETKQTLQSMARGKSPGVDGLTFEIYVKNWGVLAPPSVEVYNEILTGGRLGKGMTHGVISVLFKKGDKAEGRSIFNNIVTAIETLEIVQKEELDIAVLLLDLEKAYDKVGWPFVLTTLRHMGFGEGFCAWVIAMYANSTSAVMINGHISETFSISRSLRQGCPLAPLIFVLQLEVLLNRIRRHPDIRGQQLHTGEQCKAKALADDLFAVSVNTHTSLSALKSAMSECTSLSEATVNWSKSTFLLPSQFTLVVEWGMRRVERGEEERFLGVLISMQVEASTQGMQLQQRITTRLRIWGTVWHLSLVGRALVTNAALLSILWFVTMVRELAGGGDQGN